jgi:putative transposase
MRKSRFDETQVVGILRAADEGRTVVELCRENGISRETFKRWRSKYGRLEVAEVQQLRRLDQENRDLRRALETLTLDNRMLRDVVSRKW